MKDLIGLLENSGLQNVRSYIQSGNIVFNHDDKPEHDFEVLISKAILDEFGYEVPVIVIKSNYLKSVLEKNPFLKRDEIEPAALHVTFLSGYPDEADIQQILEIQSPPDALLPGDKVFYIWCPKGYGRTRFNNDFFEKKTKLSATTRNWKTCNKLLEMVS